MSTENRLNACRSEAVMSARTLAAASFAAAITLATIPAHADPGDQPGWIIPDNKPNDHAKCVTGSEFGQLDGQTRDEGEAFLDGPGYPSAIYKTGRDYRPCGVSWELGRVVVSYGKADRLWSAVRVKAFVGEEMPLPAGHPRARGGAA